MLLAATLIPAPAFLAGGAPAVQASAGQPPKSPAWFPLLAARGLLGQLRALADAAAGAARARLARRRPSTPPPVPVPDPPVPPADPFESGPPYDPAARYDVELSRITDQLIGWAIRSSLPRRKADVAARVAAIAEDQARALARMRWAAEQYGWLPPVEPGIEPDRALELAADQRRLLAQETIAEGDLYGAVNEADLAVARLRQAAAERAFEAAVSRNWRPSFPGGESPAALVERLAAELEAIIHLPVGAGPRTDDLRAALDAQRRVAALRLDEAIKLLKAAPPEDAVPDPADPGLLETSPHLALLEAGRKLLRLASHGAEVRGDGELLTPAVTEAQLLVAGPRFDQAAEALTTAVQTGKLNAEPIDTADAAELLELERHKLARARAALSAPFVLGELRRYFESVQQVAEVQLTAGGEDAPPEPTAPVPLARFNVLLLGRRIDALSAELEAAQDSPALAAWLADRLVELQSDAEVALRLDQADAAGGTPFWPLVAQADLDEQDAAGWTAVVRASLAGLGPDGDPALRDWLERQLRDPDIPGNDTTPPPSGGQGGTPGPGGQAGTPGPGGQGGTPGPGGGGGGAEAAAPRTLPVLAAVSGRVAVPAVPPPAASVAVPGQLAVTPATVASPAVAVGEPTVAVASPAVAVADPAVAGGGRGAVPVQLPAVPVTAAVPIGAATVATAPWPEVSVTRPRATAAPAPSPPGVSGGLRLETVPQAFAPLGTAPAGICLGC